MHPAHPGGDSRERHRFVHPPRTVAALGIEPGMQVADFGAGSGAYVFAVAEALLGSGAVYAIDIQKDLLRRIRNEADRRGFSNVHVIWSDLEEPEGSKLAERMDLVLISNLLFLAPDPDRIVEEAARVARQGGRVAIIDWSESPPHDRRASAAIGPRTDHYLAKEEVYALARGAGLTFVKEFPAGAHHYGLIFRKTASAPRRA